MDNQDTQGIPSSGTPAVEPETTAPVASPPDNKTADTPPSAVPARTVPYDRFSQVNKQMRDYQRKLAELESKQQLSGYDPNDLDTVMQHPFVQDLLIKDAKRELTDYAREILDNYPTLHATVKKAILSNVRGFVKEATKDLETAKVDLQEYIESIAAEAAPTTPPGSFPVAATNAAPVRTGATPDRINKILAKAVNEWTEEEVKLLEEYNSK